jgi:hypothetical protein
MAEAHRFGRHHVPDEARPGRSAVVARDLSLMNGPVGGVVELPLRLFWQPKRKINLDRPGVLAWMYTTVLREAISVEELETWVDGATLVRLWPSMHLPRPVRAAWERAHPELRSAASAA